MLQKIRGTKRGNCIAKFHDISLSTLLYEAFEPFEASTGNTGTHADVKQRIRYDAASSACGSCDDKNISSALPFLCYMTNFTEGFILEPEF